MDKTYAQRLHKYELVLRGFFLTALRLQLKPYKDFFISHGYLGQPIDLIRSDSLQIAYIQSYRFISDAEMYPEWIRQDKQYKASKKDFSLEDGFLIVSETLKAFFLQASMTYYNRMQSDLNDTSIQMINRFVSDMRAAGASDSEIYSALSKEYETLLRNRAGVMSATEANTIFGLVKKTTASQYYTQNGVVGYKTWFTRLDERVRHTHTEVEGRTLPMDTAFTLNNPRGGIEFAQYPGDPDLSAANRVHCRCMLEYHSDPNLYK